MKFRISVICCLIILIAVNLSAESFFSEYYMSPASIIKFNEDFTGYTSHEKEEFNQQFTYTIKEDSGLTFIIQKILQYISMVSL